MSLLLISYYNAVISIEIFLSTLMIISLYLNSITFFLSFVVFIYTLKYDLFFITMNLEIRPDIEYFVDIDEIERLKIK